MRSGILAESMQNSSGMFAESQRNLCAIHAESIYALSMLNSMQHEDFTQSSPRFHADLHAEYVPEALRNPSGILLWNPCRIYLCLIHAWFHAAWRFDANFRQISRRLACKMFSGILAESLRNPSEIFAESMRNLSMPYPFLIPCSMEIWRKFQADFTPTSMQNAIRNLDGIFAES